MCGAWETKNATYPSKAPSSRSARTVFETLVRDFSATAIELHGKASSTEPQQVWALGAVRNPVIDEARAQRIYAEVRALALLCDARLTVSDSGDLGDGAHPGKCDRL
jgi:hypothetical protein